MKTLLRPLFVLVMVVGSLIATVVFAGETYLGTVTANAAQSRSNVDAGADAGFPIPSLALVSVQCSDLAYIAVGSSSGVTASSTNGVLISSNQLLTTSVPRSQSSSGSYLAAIAGVTDGGTVSCRVFGRTGNE